MSNPILLEFWPTQNYHWGGKAQRIQAFSQSRKDVFLRWGCLWSKLCFFQCTKVPVMLSVSINVFQLIQIENVFLCLRPLQGKPQPFGYQGDIWEVLCLRLRYAENSTVVLPAAEFARRWLGLCYNLYFNIMSWFIWENKKRWNVATPTVSALTYLFSPYMDCRILPRPKSLACSLVNKCYWKQVVVRIWLLIWMDDIQAFYP